AHLAKADESDLHVSSLLPELAVLGDEGLGGGAEAGYVPAFGQRELDVFTCRLHLGEPNDR
ncbi:hypothetical protein ACFVHS_46995, partial [Streptomyces sp. NPDC057746]|uniref:hypothetical protein n=1 Tax=Streptomyces sp. NPDC057746 TaxID=3346237 RepID=UPI00368B5673